MREFDAPLLDVRSPGEFAKGRIPGAISLPLFSDEERHRVGVCYAERGQEAALELGLTFVGPKMAYFVQLARKVAVDGKIGVYCWRGGMRSQAVTQLLSMATLCVERLEGGYKRFRCWALDQLERPLELRILGGYTGSGKTEILHQLGDRVIDLEALAGHRGSSFGHLGLPTQPTQEQFENLLAYEIWRLGEGPILVEDESRMIGSIRLPKTFYLAMQKAPLWLLSSSLKERKKRLMREYGSFPESKLIEASRRIAKRLGSERTAEVIERLERKESSAMDLLLDYYDKSYQHALERREGEILPLEPSTMTEQLFETLCR